MNDHYVLWGGTGQSKVVRTILGQSGDDVALIVDDTPGLKPPFPDVPLVLGAAGLDSWREENGNLILKGLATIGNPHGRARLEIERKLEACGIEIGRAVHPSAVIDSTHAVPPGCQIHALAHIGTNVRLGRGTIINTRASVDHDCVIGAGSEIAPGATICGEVSVGENVWVCAGATVGPKIHIGANAIIAAGAVVLRDVPEGVKVIGLPPNRILTSLNPRDVIR